MREQFESECDWHEYQDMEQERISRLEREADEGLDKLRVGMQDALIREKQGE